MFKSLTCAGVVFSILIVSTAPSWAKAPANYEHQKNVVYAEVHGIGLLADIFTPNENNNGKAIVEVTSGAWHSDRGKLNDLAKAQVFDIFCEHGYTVFAIRPGSITKFSALEMVANVERGIRWVKSNANDYDIDPERLGLMGASAGGHLACMVAVTNGRPTGGDDASIAAAGIFFPATDFLDYGGLQIDPRGDNRLGQLMRRLAFPDGIDQLSDEEVQNQVTSISPARQVTANTPPFLLIHGSADFMVPLQQSQVMLAALQQHDVPAQLIVKEGGGHPWPTIHEEVGKMADWFDQQLGRDSD